MSQLVFILCSIMVSTLGQTLQRKSDWCLAKLKKLKTSSEFKSYVLSTKVTRNNLYLVM